MNREDLLKLAEETRRLATDATPGPWEKVSALQVYAVCVVGEWGVWDVVTATGREYARGAHPDKHGCKEVDAAFIAHSRTAAPQLADAVVELVAENARLIEEIRKMVPQGALEAALRECGRLRQALEFYADPFTWGSAGERARKALEGER